MFSNKELSKLRWLHTLILDGRDMTELPDSIQGLIHLKYLDTATTGITTLPESIGKLYLFQTLRATSEHGVGTSYLKKLPVSFKYLISLRHLLIPNIQLPPEVGKLTSLQTLPYFFISDEVGCRIVELGKLTNLRGELEIAHLGKVRDKQEAEMADLFHKPDIYRLKLLWFKDTISSDSDRDRDEKVLEGLQPHPNLKSLDIRGFRGRRFPSWAVKMDEHLNNLIELTLTSCKLCEEIPTLGQLPHLKCLILSRLRDLKSIGSSFYGVGGNETTVNVFPELQRIELRKLKNLRVWEDVKSSSSSSSSALIFPCLEVLVMTSCRRLESAPSEFPCLKELEISFMESPLPLANICGYKLKTLRKLSVWKVDGLASLPDGLFSRNRDLSEVTIKLCNRLTHLRNCGASSSLWMLSVQFCENLTEYVDLGSFEALEDLEIVACPKFRPKTYSSMTRLKNCRIK